MNFQTLVNKLLHENNIIKQQKFDTDFYLGGVEFTFDVMVDENTQFVDEHDVSRDQQGRITQVRRNGHMLHIDHRNKTIQETDSAGREVFFMAFDDDGRLTSYVDAKGDTRRYEYDSHGVVIDRAAISKAQEYNKLFHGLFMHSVVDYHLPEFLQSTRNNNADEVCVCSARSSTAYGTEWSNAGDWITLIGFGRMLQLFDTDVKSLPTSLRSGSGKRLAHPTHANHPSIELFPKNIHQYSSHMLKFHGKQGMLSNGYYDEGLMHPTSMKVVAAVIPDAFSHKQVRDIKTAILKYFPHTKFMTAQQFEKYKNSEQLLALAYSVQQQQDIEHTRSVELGMHEEQTLPTFEQFFRSATV